MRFKQYINTLFACGLLAISVISCTSDDITDTGGNGRGELPEGAITFKIAGINTGAVQTRAVGDPVIATEAENRVNDLAIFVFTSATNSANDADYVYHSYWTNGYVMNGVVNEDRNIFKLGGSGQFRTATIVLPKTVKYAKFLFLTAHPRLFRMDATGENMTELPRVYNIDEPLTGEVHVYDNHSFEGMTLAEVKALQMVKAGATANVPVSKLGYTLNLASSYFDLDAANAADALDMTGISANAIEVSSTNAQNMDMTLYRNVVRLDVNNADQLDITDLKIVNVPVTTGVENGAPNMAVLGGTPASTYSLMKEVDGVLTCQGSRYCYPANNDATNELKLQVTVGTSVTPIELPIETVDGDKVSLLRNHRYIVNLRKSADNYVDANIVVVDWNVGDNVSVDMEAGQNLTEPVISLITGTAGMNSDNALAFWQGTTKVTTRMHDSYIYEGEDVADPAYYPWLRFDMPRVGSLGIRAFVDGSELDYLNQREVAALGNPYNAIESENGTVVRNELAVVPVEMACSYWLVLQNNYAPEKRRMVKVEIGNMLYSSAGVYTPSLMRFAETNVKDDGTLIDFPEGGYDNPYGLVNVPAGDAVRGQSATTHALPAGYALPAKEYMRNITPDYAAVGTFGQYNGVNVYSVTQPDGTVVYYSGSKVDKTVIKLVVQKSTGVMMAGQKYVSGTMWKYVSTAQGDYLKVMQVRTADENTTYKNYTSMYDFFSGKVTMGVVTRYFPAAATGDTYYLGDGGCAMKFNADGVVFVETYAGTGYQRPVQTRLVWDEPAPVILTSGNPLVLDSGWIMSDGADTEIGVG
ncbi:FimB/Mfa2 family fimbrial subunit [Bacteroides sp.]